MERPLSRQRILLSHLASGTKILSLPTAATDACRTTYSKLSILHLPLELSVLNYFDTCSIADTDGSSSGVDELVPEFEVNSGPFVEFKFYYKSRGKCMSLRNKSNSLLMASFVADLLESLKIARAVRSRRGVGLPSSKSLTDLPSEFFASPTNSNSGQLQGQSQKRQRPAPEIVHSPSSRTISGKQNGASTSRSKGHTGLREARNPSLELSVPPTSTAAFRQPATRPDSASRLPTPYYPRTPASGSPPRKRPATTQLPAVETQQPQKKQKTIPQRPQQQNNDHVETASLPSPPASPVPSTHSDASLPSLSDLLQFKKASPAKQASPTRPFSGLGVSGHSWSSSRMSPSRPQASTSSTAQQACTPPKRHLGGRPPLIPGVRKTAVRKEPTAAESNAARAAILGRAPDSAPARQATQAVPQVSTPPVSGSGPVKLPAPAQTQSAAPMPTPDATAAASSTSVAQTSGLVLSSPLQKPDITSLNAVPSPARAPAAEAGPSTPRASTSTATAATPTAATPSAATAKAEQVTPKINQTPSRSGASSIKVKQEASNVIDLTLDSDAEDDASEEESKKNIKSGMAKSTEATKKEIADRKSAHEHATDLLNNLDIYDVGNVDALINVGYKTTKTFVDRLGRLDEDYKRDIMQGLMREMGKLDFGLLRAFLKSQGLELAY